MPKITPPPTVDPAQRYSIPEAAAILRQSRAQLYIDIRERRVRVIHDRSRTYVHGAELIRRARVGMLETDECAA
jgi:hypothetical protein